MSNNLVVVRIILKSIKMREGSEWELIFKRNLLIIVIVCIIITILFHRLN